MSWQLGDVLRHPDGRTGHVIGLGQGTVLVRLPGGAVEAWPEDALEGTRHFIDIPGVTDGQETV